MASDTDISTLNSLIKGAKREQTFAGWNVSAETRILHQCGPARSEIADRPVAKPPAVGIHIDALSDREFRPGSLHVATEVVGRCSHPLWIHDLPIVSEQ